MLHLLYRNHTGTQVLFPFCELFFYHRPQPTNGRMQRGYDNTTLSYYYCLIVVGKDAEERLSSLPLRCPLSSNASQVFIYLCQVKQKLFYNLRLVVKWMEREEVYSSVTSLLSIREQ